MADGKMRFRRFLFPLLEIPGLVVIFLPFTFGVSPYDALADLSWEPLTIPAALSLLAIPILASTVRRLIGGEPSRAETWIAYGLAASALVASVAFTIVSYWPDVEWFLACASGWATMLAMVALCILNVRKGVQHAVNAHVCLLCSYVPNAVIALVAFRDDLQSGAYVCLVAVAAYVGEAVVRTMQAVRCAGEGARPGIGPQSGEA